MIAGLPEAKFGEGPCFARLAAVAQALGLELPALSPRQALIVGSNGKGSTAGMTAAALSLDLERVGLFTSPHLTHVTERIRIDGAPVPFAALEEASRTVAKARATVLRPGHGAMGAFEHLVLCAALLFANARCEAIVWEAGIGGRFDPTRAVKAHAGALTSLDLEHTALLGDTLEAIACDKLDGFAPGAAVACGPAAAALEPRLTAYAALTGKTLAFPKPAPGPFEAAFQAENAGLAMWLAQRLRPAPDQAARLEAVRAARPPGRLERVSDDPLILIDIAHTPDAAARALQGFRQARPEGGALLMAVSPGKKASEIAAALAPAFARIGCVAPRHSGRPAAEIAALAAAAAPEARVETFASSEAALRALSGEGAVFVCGSLYLAAEVKALCAGLDPAALWFL